MGIEELILAEREERGKIECKVEIITNMLRKNLADEMIADLAEISLEYVREMRKKMG